MSSTRVKLERKRKLAEVPLPNKKVPRKPIPTLTGDPLLDLDLITPTPTTIKNEQFIKKQPDEDEPEDITPISASSHKFSANVIFDVEDDVEEVTPVTISPPGSIKKENVAPVNRPVLPVKMEKLIKPELVVKPEKLVVVKPEMTKKPVYAPTLDEKPLDKVTEDDFEAPPPPNESVHRLTPQQQRMVRSDFETLPTIEAPNTILFPLKFYQKQGVCWMNTQEKTKRGGVLADEMGLGKTLMTLTTCMLDNQKRNLIVVEKSLIDNWKCEIEKFVKDVNVSVFHGKNRDKASILNLCDFTITTYGTLGIEYKKFELGQETVLFKINWHRVILDESHKIKNQRTACAKSCYALKSVHRWCLTGTPIHNELGDLYSYFKFLKYGPYDQDTYFRNYVVVPIQTNPSLGFVNLMDIMKGIMLRRTKNCTIQGERLIELLDKEIKTIEFEFEDKEEIDLYEKVFKKVQIHLEKLLRDGTQAVMKEYMFFLTQILRLKQICDHHYLAMESKKEKIKINCLQCENLIHDGVMTPCEHLFCDLCIEGRLTYSSLCPVCKHPISEETLKPVSTRPVHMRDFVHSSKTRKIMAELQDILANHKDDKILIFSQWTNFLDILEIPLKQAKISFIRVDGTTSMEERKERFDEFKKRKDGTLRVALLSLRSCGVGLNLVEANHVFMTDLWWNPQVEFQAIDRVHRIGQVKQVYVYKFIVKDSIETKILKIQESKAILAEGVTGGGYFRKIGQVEC